MLYSVTKPQWVNWIEMVRRTVSNWRPSAHKQTTTWYVTANTLRWHVCTTMNGFNSLILDRVTCNLIQEFSSMLYDCTDSMVARKSTNSSRQQLSCTGCPMPRPKLDTVYFIKRQGFIIIHVNYKWVQEFWMGRFLTNHIQDKVIWSWIGDGKLRTTRQCWGCNNWLAIRHAFEAYTHTPAIVVTTNNWLHI